MGYVTPACPIGPEGYHPVPFFEQATPRIRLRLHAWLIALPELPTLTSQLSGSDVCLSVSPILQLTEARAYTNPSFPNTQPRQVRQNLQTKARLRMIAVCDGRAAKYRGSRDGVGAVRALSLPPERLPISRVRPPSFPSIYAPFASAMSFLDLFIHDEPRGYVACTTNAGDGTLPSPKASDAVSTTPTSADEKSDTAADDPSALNATYLVPREGLPQRRLSSPRQLLRRHLLLPVRTSRERPPPRVRRRLFVHDARAKLCSSLAPRGCCFKMPLSGPGTARRPRRPSSSVPRTSSTRSSAWRCSSPTRRRYSLVRVRLFPQPLAPLPIANSYLSQPGLSLDAKCIGVPPRGLNCVDVPADEEL